jgi:hypothetical protein
VDLQPVRHSVILGGDLDAAVGADAEDLAERRVDDIEVAVAVEARPFEEGMDRPPEMALGPGIRARLQAQRVNDRDEDLGLQVLRRREQDHRLSPSRRPRSAR